MSTSDESPADDSTSSGKTGPEKAPADLLIDLLLYAPVGFIYEYEDVLETLVKRGKSQVQIARLIGQMAAKKGQSGVEENVGEAVTAAADVLARAVTEFGSMIGLAPPEAKAAPKPEPAPPPPNDSATKTATASKAPKSAKGVGRVGASATPIAGYDDLTAKEIIGMLADLNSGQRDRVRSYESAHRGRKTILAKLDRLAG